jgi:hypothetical protein
MSKRVLFPQPGTPRRTSKRLKRSPYEPRILHLNLEHYKDIFKERASKFGTYTERYIPQVAKGPNVNNYLIPDKGVVKYVARIKTSKKTHWSEVEKLVKDWFGSKNTTGNANRHIDQIWYHPKGEYIYLEVKKTSGSAFDWPRTIGSSVKQLHALVEARKEKQCKGCFYLICSDDVLRKEGAKKRSRGQRYITVWMAEVTALNKWRIFSTDNNKMEKIKLSNFPDIVTVE